MLGTALMLFCDRVRRRRLQLTSTSRPAFVSDKDGHPRSEFPAPAFDEAGRRRPVLPVNCQRRIPPARCCTRAPVRRGGG